MKPAVAAAFPESSLQKLQVYLLTLDVWSAIKTTRVVDIELRWIVGVPILPWVILNQFHLASLILDFSNVGFGWVSLESVK